MRKFLIFTTFLCLVFSVKIGFADSAGDDADTTLALAKAHFYYSQQKYEEAVEILEELLEAEPENIEAYRYLTLCFDKLYENNYTEEELIQEQRTGAMLASIRRAKRMAYNDQGLRAFSNKFTIGRRNIKAHPSADTDFDKRGFVISENLRWNTFVSGYETTILADVDYFANSHRDGRLRNLTCKFQNEDAYLTLGDNISDFSRYLVRGIEYRGLNFKVSTLKNELKFLGGVAPYFKVDKDEYIHPRSVFGLFDEYAVSEGYKIGMGFHYIKDTDSVREIDSANNPKENLVFGFNQKISLLPNIWEVEAESAYSRTDLDTTNEDIIDKNIIKKDFANYIKSELKFRDIRLLNSYERIGADFRSLVGLSSKNYRVPASAISADREHILSSLAYTGFKYCDFKLDLSRTQNNLDDDSDVARTRQKWFGANLNFKLPQQYPRVGLRTSYLESVSVPGSDYTTDDEIYRDIILEAAKDIWGVDVDGYYLNRKVIENTKEYGTYSDLFTLRGSKRLFDKYLVSCAYSFSKSYKNVDGADSRIDREKFADLDLSWNIYKNANIFIGYNFTNTKDYDILTDAYNTHSLSTVFSWPYAKYFTNGGRLAVSPYLSFHKNETRDTTTQNRDRTVLSASLKASYSPDLDNEISLSAEYRRDTDDEVLNVDTKECRVFLSWKALFGP